MQTARSMWGLVTGLGLMVGSASAFAQMSLPPDAGELGACICLRQAVDFLQNDMNAKQQTLASVRTQLDQLTRQLDAERTTLNVNDPSAVARFRQQVEQREALFKRANGSAFSEADTAVQRYNARVGEYNARCATRPMEPAAVARIQPTLTCPPPY